MRIKIDSLDFVHQFLLRREPGDSSELWREEVRQEPVPFSYPPAPLDPPLEDVSVGFKRCGDHYSVLIPIDSRSPNVFLGTYNDFQKALDPLGYLFKPLYTPAGNILDGSIGRLRKNGNIEFSLAPANDNNMRILALGSLGAYTRPFPEDSNRFAQEIRTLESVLNAFLGCLLPPPKDDSDGNSEEDVIYLNP